MWLRHPVSTDRTAWEGGLGTSEEEQSSLGTWRHPKSMHRPSQGAQRGHPGTMAKTAQGCGQGTPAHGQGTPGCGSLTHVVVDWQVLLGELPCPTLGPRLHVLLQLVFAPPIQPALAVCEQLRVFFFCPFKVGQLRSYKKSPNVAVNNHGTGRQTQQQELMSL